MPFQIAPLVTIGFGTGMSIVTLGFGPIAAVVQVLRGGRSLAKKIYAEQLEKFTIKAMLIELNGKELLSPLTRSKDYVLEENDNNVKIRSVKVQSKRRRIINVVANLTNLKRGSNADD
tara:strand:- start:18 stop:371 length:354 start_codon:yes stop_codon:yes gene_type:complete